MALTPEERAALKAKMESVRAGYVAPEDVPTPKVPAPGPSWAGASGPASLSPFSGATYSFNEYLRQMLAPPNSRPMLGQAFPGMGMFPPPPFGGGFPGGGGVSSPQSGFDQSMRGSSTAIRAALLNGIISRDEAMYLLGWTPQRDIWSYLAMGSMSGPVAACRFGTSLRSRGGTTGKDGGTGAGTASTLKSMKLYGCGCDECGSEKIQG